MFRRHCSRAGDSAVGHCALSKQDNTKLIASTQVHAFNGEESTARIGHAYPVQTAQAYPFGVQTGTTQPGKVFRVVVSP